MNDNASLALGSARGGLGGLPQRLVQDGVVDEAAMLEALSAARERKTSVVTQLVSSGVANARHIAGAATDEYGVPLLATAADSPNPDTGPLVSDTPLAKHRVPPILRASTRPLLTTADTT